MRYSGHIYLQISVMAAGRAKVMQNKQTWIGILEVVENRVQHQTVIADYRAWRPEAEAVAVGAGCFDGILDSSVMLFSWVKVQ